MKPLKIGIMVLILLLSYAIFLVPITGASSNPKANMSVLQDGNGIRIAAKEVEFYFNATNGGEITQYFDLTVDPNRSRNLVNMGWKPFYNLLPLFTSLLYKPPNSTLVLSTGGDPNAKLWLQTNTSDYVILQTSSRIMSRAGEVYKDVYGNAVYVNSTWIIRNSGLISVERTFLPSGYATFSSGWRWYPFYLTRTASSNYSFTFLTFNTTYTNASVVNGATYKDIFASYSLLPNDTSYVSGVAFPFSNTSMGGDGSHNLLIAYRYDELVKVDQWRSDNCYAKWTNITEGGAAYEFGDPYNAFPHTYHMLVNFTREPVNELTAQSFAAYYANHPSAALTMESSVNTNKDVYYPGDSYVFYASGISYFDLTLLSGMITVTSSSNSVMYQQSYGPANITAGMTFNLTLLKGTVAPIPDKYTILFQIITRSGITVSSSSKTITVAVP